MTQLIMIRYRLRTLLVLLAILPPLLWFGWTKYDAWRAEQERQRAMRDMACTTVVVQVPDGGTVLIGGQPKSPPPLPRPNGE